MKLSIKRRDLLLGKISQFQMTKKLYVVMERQSSPASFFHPENQFFIEILICKFLIFPSPP